MTWLKKTMRALNRTMVALSTASATQAHQRSPRKPRTCKNTELRHETRCTLS